MARKPFGHTGADGKEAFWLCHRQGEDAIQRCKEAGPGKLGKFLSIWRAARVVPGCLQEGNNFGVEISTAFGTVRDSAGLLDSHYPCLESVSVPPRLRCLNRGLGLQHTADAIFEEFNDRVNWFMPPTCRRLLTESIIGVRAVSICACVVPRA